MDIRVEITGLDGAIKELRQMRDRADDWTPLSQEFHDILLERMQERFDSQNRSEGFGAWPGYEGEPKYRAFKRAILGHLEILRWEKGGTYEMLYPSLTDASDGHHIYAQRGKRSWVFGTSVEHAPDVQEATTGPFGEPSPPRNFTEMGNETKGALVETVVRWVFKGDI